MKYTVNVTCRAFPLQLEGLTEDGRSYYFRARNGEWYLSIVPTGTDDMERVLPVSPVAKGDDPDGILAAGAECEARKLIHPYLIDKGKVNGNSPFGNIAYSGPTENQRPAEREVVNGKVVTHGTQNPKN